MPAAAISVALRLNTVSIFAHPASSMGKPIDTAAVRAAIAQALSDPVTLAFLEDHGGSARWLRDGLVYCERMDALSGAEGDLRAWLRAFRRVSRAALSSRPDLAQALQAPSMASVASVSLPLEPDPVRTASANVGLKTVSKLDDPDAIPHVRPNSAEAEGGTR